MVKDPTYDDGRQDAWIAALREQVARIEGTVDGIRIDVRRISAKVNHIYGFAAALGAFSAVLVLLADKIVDRIFG